MSKSSLCRGLQARHAIHLCPPTSKSKASLRPWSVAAALQAWAV